MNRTRICKWKIETPKYKKGFHSIKRKESKNILPTSYTMTATEESLIQLEMRLLNLSCPAVSLSNISRFDV